MEEHAQGAIQEVLGSRVAERGLEGALAAFGISVLAVLGYRLEWEW